MVQRTGAMAQCSTYLSVMTLPEGADIALFVVVDIHYIKIKVTL